MAEIIAEQSPKNKIYKDMAIWVGTFLGGPLVAGYLIAENFKVFNDPVKARKTWIYAILATVIIIGIVLAIPDNINLPNTLIPLIYTVIAFSLARHFQGQNITEYLNSGGKFFGWWRTIAIALIGGAITFIPIAGFIFLIYSNDKIPEMTNTYGITRNEITFGTNNISNTEVNKIADALTKTTYFDDEETKYVYAKKVNNNYELSVSIGKDIADDKEHLQLYIFLRDDLQTFFPNHKIIFKFVGDDLDDVVKTIE